MNNRYCFMALGEKKWVFRVCWCDITKICFLLVQQFICVARLHEFC
jgi:hypothetical protein